MINKGARLHMQSYTYPASFVPEEIGGLPEGDYFEIYMYVNAQGVGNYLYFYYPLQ
jgi:hypothetical protein